VQVRTSKDGAEDLQSSKEKAREVLNETGGDGDDSPSHHDGDQKVRRSDTGDDHIGWDTEEDVSDKENRDTCLVLDIGQTQVLDQ
jgi:hypothetical protein